MSLNLDEFFAEAKRLNIRILGSHDDTRAALDLKDAEIAALRKDAERWRMARLLARFRRIDREERLTIEILPRPLVGMPTTPDYADAAIDAAMALHRSIGPQGKER